MTPGEEEADVDYSWEEEADVEDSWEEEASHKTGLAPFEEYCTLI